MEEYLSAQADTVRALLYGGGDLAGCSPKARAHVGKGDTTHISAVDGNGVVASITTSVGEWFGSAVAAPGGYLMAQSYQMAAGRRRAARDITYQAPTILELPMGERAALGVVFWVVSCDPFQEFPQLTPPLGPRKLRVQCCAPS
ncbi:gamma-glutamyltransferase [Mesorhizobium sp. M0965]|uniref:gamma-glutamyltransferase n=1 Tax=unclassified Mesorhizobium TaxID=325217 RepID=UPI003337B27F